MRDLYRDSPFAFGLFVACVCFTVTTILTQVWIWLT